MTLDLRAGLQSDSNDDSDNEKEDNGEESGRCKTVIASGNTEQYLCRRIDVNDGEMESIQQGEPSI